jgi:hypothetical protein
VIVTLAPGTSANEVDCEVEGLLSVTVVMAATAPPLWVTAANAEVARGRVLSNRVMATFFQWFMKFSCAGIPAR